MVNNKVTKMYLVRTINFRENVDIIIIEERLSFITAGTMSLIGDVVDECKQCSP